MCCAHIVKFRFKSCDPWSHLASSVVNICYFVKFTKHNLKSQLTQTFQVRLTCISCSVFILCTSSPTHAVKGKASSLDIVPLTILNSGALQPRKWQLTGNDCSTAAQAVAAQSPR